MTYCMLYLLSASTHDKESFPEGGIFIYLVHFCIPRIETSAQDTAGAQSHLLNEQQSLPKC